VTAWLGRPSWACASGKDNPHATRILARAQVMWRCRQVGTTCDPTLHGGAQHHTDRQAAA
jgi:hypothetical protein